jgi:hypothetical protein
MFILSELREINLDIRCDSLQGKSAYYEPSTIKVEQLEWYLQTGHDRFLTYLSRFIIHIHLTTTHKVAQLMISLPITIFLIIFLK